MEKDINQARIVELILGSNDIQSLNIFPELEFGM